MAGRAMGGRIDFSPTDFYEDLSSSINEQIDVQVESFKKELLTVAKKGGNKIVNNENIGECCDKLRKRMKNSYATNLSKFSIYADRNIFVVNPLPAAKPTAAPAVVPKSDLEIVTDEVEVLRNKYLSSREKLIQLTTACREGDLLLKDMRKTLFTIRVGAQTLDECNLQPLSETVATLEQHQQTMTELSSRAKDLKRQMSEFCEEESVRTNQSQAILDEQIITGGQDDIRTLNSNLLNEK